MGNLWRFPFLAAKDGGGVFLLIYLVLIFTVGFVLLTTDIAIGRRLVRVRFMPMKCMNRKWKFLGVITFFVPVLIMTYYAVIGGWILKYILLFATGNVETAAQGQLVFTSFITEPGSVWVIGLIFMLITSFIVYNGVEKGIERVSKTMMPILLVIVVGIAIYSLTLKSTADDGVSEQVCRD